MAKVKPIFKKGRKNNVSNYRPIFLLPILSRVIKNVVHEQTSKFLNDNNIFYKYQTSFRNNDSTDLFLPFLNDKRLKGFDNGVYTGMILIDLQKAFDTINHKILLGKLLPIGFSKNTISGYESYLAERHVTVEVANRVSKFLKISCGVPQGSILGPLLFLIYANGMSQANQRFQQCVTSTVSKFVQSKWLAYMNDVFKPAESLRINTRNSFLELNHLF